MNGMSMDKYIRRSQQTTDRIENTQDETHILWFVEIIFFIVGHDIFIQLIYLFRNRLH